MPGTILRTDGQMSETGLHGETSLYWRACKNIFILGNLERHGYSGNSGKTQSFWNNWKALYILDNLDISYILLSLGTLSSIFLFLSLQTNDTWANSGQVWSFNPRQSQVPGTRTCPGQGVHYRPGQDFGLLLMWRSTKEACSGTFVPEHALFRTIQLQRCGHTFG